MIDTTSRDFEMFVPCIYITLFTYYHISIVLLIVFVDLYSAWLAPRFKSDLLVETWQNGPKKLCSNCTGPYKVQSVYV